MRRSLKTDDLKNYNFSDDEEEEVKDRWSELLHHVQTQTFWFCVQILVVLMLLTVLTEYYFIIWRYMEEQGRVPVLHLYIGSKPWFYMPFVFSEMLLEFGITGSSGNFKCWFLEILCYTSNSLFYFFKCWKENAWSCRFGLKTINWEYIYYFSPNLHEDSEYLDIHLTHRLNKPQIYRGLKFCHFIKATYCKNLTVNIWRELELKMYLLLFDLFLLVMSCILLQSILCLCLVCFFFMLVSNKILESHCPEFCCHKYLHAKAHKPILHVYSVF